MTTEDSIPPVPEPRVTVSRRRPSLVWLVPVIAVLIGASMLIRAWVQAGPHITITFQTATGLEAGKTTVKYKDVVIGNVTSISLGPDNSNVIVGVELKKSAEKFAQSGARFWVVRPRIGAGGVSGIDTVLSGAYIGVDLGKSDASKRDFVGLETPPSVISGTPGKSFLLHAKDLGSLEIGSPVYYRRINVGQVASYHLDKDGKGVTVQVFINAPSDGFVTTDTRFWNASGVNLSFGPNGLKFDTQSLATVVAGGIAFATPDGESGGPADEKTPFVLAADEKSAMADSDGVPVPVRMRFNQSLRGLAVGAPVEFMGMEVGRVTAINVDYNPKTMKFPVIVDANVYPMRLPLVHRKLTRITGDRPEAMAQFLGVMVQHGLRAQPRPGNLLTGQLYIAFDFVSNASHATFQRSGPPWNVPTVRADFTRMQEQVASIVNKLDRVPFDDIGRHLDEDLVGANATLGKANQTLDQINGEVLPDVQATMQNAREGMNNLNGALAPDAPLQQNMEQTMRELQRAARAVKAFTDMLSRHPESMIRGRAEDSLPEKTVPARKSKKAQEAQP